MQALLTLKILLNMTGQLDSELLLLDFMNFSTLKIKATRRPECRAPACTHIRGIAGPTGGIEVPADSLEEAARRGFEVIDIRSTEEIAAQPSGMRHIPMQDLLMHPDLLPSGRPILLLCASGKRSLATAEALLQRGIAVQSLAGGLRGLEPEHALQQ
jgi:rhodanese-related sulfurtransferase